MSLTGDNTAKFWASCPKVLNHRRRSSSSGLFNLNITEPILSRYKHLAKLHSDSSTLGLNAVNKSSLPRGTLFRSSLPATPLTSPMYTSILNQFTEKAIQELLGKSSTPKVVKCPSDSELKSNLKSSDQSTIGSKTRTNLFDLIDQPQNIITRSSLNRTSLPRPKTLDIKSKIKLDTNLTKINENGKLDEDNESTDLNNKSLTSSLYYSIKEEQEETDSDCITEKSNKSDQSIENKSVGDKSIDLSMNKLNLSSDEPNKSSTQTDTTIINNAIKNNSTIETIVLSDNSTSKIEETIIQNLNNVSIDDKKTESKLIINNGLDKEKVLNTQQQNGFKHESKEIVNEANCNNDSELQQNCLFVKNLHYNLNNDELRDFFCKFGKVTNARIIFDHHSKNSNSKGFGFVNFENQNDVQKIISMPKKDLNLKGRQLHISIAKNKKK